MNKNTLLIVILLLITGNMSMYGMQPQVANSIGEALITDQNPAEFPQFAQLPKEIQNEILSMFTVLSVTNSLADAGQTISALAGVTKELDKKFNEPKFCLQLIKYLAAKFDCSDEDAAKALSFREAKNRLANQMQLAELIYDFGDINTVDSVDQISNLLQTSNLDMTFTVNNERDESPRFCTPLHVAVSSNHTCADVIQIISLLLKNGANPRLSSDGITPLTYATSMKWVWGTKCPETVKVLARALKKR